MRVSLGGDHAMKRNLTKSQRRRIRELRYQQRFPWAVDIRLGNGRGCYCPHGIAARRRGDAVYAAV